nr:hypothetical protein [Tanacetum cinerariifolium]
MQVQQGEGSNTTTEPYHTPSPEALSPSHTTHTSPTLSLVTTTSIPTVTLTETTPIRQYTRRARIAQSSALPTVADDPDSPLRDVSQGEACPTESGFIADQDKATITKSSTLPHDSAPRVTSPTAVEGSMQQIIPELTALCSSLQRQLSELTAKFQAQEVEINRLKDRVKLLEDKEGVAASRSGDDAPIKGRSMDEGDVATKRISDDSEEMETVLTSMDAAIVLASRVVDVPTGSGSIPTASTPAEEQVPTGSDVVPTAKSSRADRCPAYQRIRRATREKRSEKRSYWKITRLGGSSASYQFFIYLLKHLDREDLNQLWRLVKETLSHRPPTSKKKMELQGEFNTDFHPMVDFIAASPLRYALTIKPTIFVSHIRQFWSTVRIETTDEGTHILATVD